MSYLSIRDFKEFENIWMVVWITIKDGDKRNA